MSASWRELAQIKTSGPIPQAPDSISWGWSPASGVSDVPLGDADAGGLGAQENPGVLTEGGAVPGSGGAAPLVSHLKWLKTPGLAGGSLSAFLGWSPRRQLGTAGLKR